MDNKRDLLLADECDAIHLSMQQLDPEPFSEHEINYDNGFPPEIPLSTCWTLPLGLSFGGARGKSPVYYLTKLQKYSSYAFTVFASLHITNTSLIPLLTRSVSASESYLLLTRPYYQSFPLEPLLVSLPVIIHVASGIALRIHQRNVNLQRYGARYIPISERLEKRLKVWPLLSWSSLAGYLMIPLVGGHALINRVVPWIYEGGSSSVGLGYVAHSFAKHPHIASFSYTMMVGLAAGHFCWGLCRWNRLIIGGDGQKARRRWWAINGVSAALAVTWMAGGFGIIARGGRADGWIGKGYDKLLQHLWL